MPTKSKYEPRYCAFVDILGFTELINQVDRGDRKFQFLRDLLERVHAPASDSRIRARTADFRAQSVSDAIALSAKTNPEGLWYILRSLEILSIDLLKGGFFVRGAIVRDKLYHDKNMVFGRALVKAYQLETQTVIYPRIMVTSDVAKDMQGFASAPNTLWNHIFRDVLKRADDGPYFLNVLRNEMNRGIGEKIVDRLTEATDNPSHFAKVRWFASYWNDALNNPKHPWRIEWPGLDSKSGVWG